MRYQTHSHRQSLPRPDGRNETWARQRLAGSCASEARQCRRDGGVPRSERRSRISSRRPCLPCALTILACALPVFGSPKFEARVEPESVRAGKSVRLTVSATWDGDSTQCLIEEVKVEAPSDVERGEVQPGRGEFSVRRGEPGSALAYECMLKPLKEGEYSVDTVEVKFRLPSTKPGEWETWSPSVAPKFTAKRSLAVPKGLGITAAIVGGVLAVIVVTFAVATIRYRRAMAPAPDEADLETPVLERLNDLRSLRIKGDYKAFFGRLESLVGEYLREKYAIKSDSDDALARAVEADLDENLARRLKDVLGLAETVRFGGAPPLPTDLDRAHATVREILERNQPKRDEDPESQIAYREG